MNNGSNRLNTISCESSNHQYRGEFPNDCACHKCDNRACVRPDHLWDGTIAENIADMDAKGRRVITSNFGETNGSAKLVETQVREIRQLLNLGESHSTIAKKYQVSKATIQHISSGRIWGWLKN